MKWLLIVAIAACGDDAHMSAPDASRTRKDGGLPYPCIPGGNAIDTATCIDGKATTRRDLYSSQAGCPAENDYKDETICAQGCALSVDKRMIVMNDHGLEPFGKAARVLCAESLAHVGDTCTTDGTRPCLPTRAMLNGDGTVASQTYLACVSGQCAATSAPAGTVPLPPCTALLISAHGGASVNGFVMAGQLPLDDTVALLAWDDTMQMTACGMSHSCVGDWQCGVGMLCDDMITPLEMTAHAAVCKPGPRGTLTPSMLSAGL
jgi:hypothetical protein